MISSDTITRVSLNSHPLNTRSKWRNLRWIFWIWIFLIVAVVIFPKDTLLPVDENEKEIITKTQSGIHKEELQQNLWQKNQEKQQQQQIHDQDILPIATREIPGLFTIVMLLYKAPRSSKNTLRSLGTSGIVLHPQFHEIIIYKQLLDKARVIEEEAQLSDAVWGNNNDNNENKYNDRLKNASRKLRIIGTPRNIAVPKAMFSAMQAVETEYVLYIECDRPVYSFPFGVNNAFTSPSTNINSSSFISSKIIRGETNYDSFREAELVHSYVISIITMGLNYLKEDKAHVFRLQLYASNLLHNSSLLSSFNVSDDKKIKENANMIKRRRKRYLTSENLPLAMYGTTPYEYCHATPDFHLPKGICTKEKEYRLNKYGSTFDWAYCRHWQRFTDSTTRPTSLCDALCAKEWIVAAKSKHESIKKKNLGFSSLWKFFEEFNSPDSLNNMSSNNNNNNNNNNTINSEPEFMKRIYRVNTSSISTLHGFTHDIVCFPSSLCNWTNQPSLYKKSWFINIVIKNCLSRRKMCIGLPGRGSAAMLERFMTELRPWRKGRFNICLSDGLFIHDEIDNF